MRRISTIVVLAALTLAATELGAQDLGQLNWRATDLERRIAAAEAANANLAAQLQSTISRLSTLETRFSQLVGILDQRLREDTAERLRLRAEEEKRAKAQAEKDARSKDAPGKEAPGNEAPAQPGPK